MIPRSLAIARTWRNLDVPSLFSAVLYPALGVLVLTATALIGLISSAVHLAWWHAPLALAACAASVFACNLGIGPLHRIIQHRAGELRWPAMLLVLVNCVVAMQGRVRDWVNYHSQHHRFADQPGDPHNPFESKSWAWVGWLLFRDPADLARPVPLWLKDNRLLRVFDVGYEWITLAVHLFAPALVYLVVWAAGGSLALTAILHASAVIGRGMHFHATTLGVNVLGHLPTPKWLDHVMALLTGGEAFHDHHHDEPASALHRPRRGLWNRIVDYNGTILLAFEKLGLARNLKIAPQFA